MRRRGVGVEDRDPVLSKATTQIREEFGGQQVIGQTVAMCHVHENEVVVTVARAHESARIGLYDIDLRGIEAEVIFRSRDRTRVDLDNVDVDSPLF